MVARGRAGVSPSAKYGEGVGGRARRRAATRAGLGKKSRSPGCYGKFTSSQSSEGLSEGDIIIVNVGVVVCWKSYNAFCTPQKVVVGHYREVVIARVQYPKCPALVVIPVV
jgi:hypothetical protein